MNAIAEPKAPSFMQAKGKLKTQAIWPLWLASGAALFLGCCAGAWWMTNQQAPELEQQRRSISNLNGRVALLTSALNSQSELFAQLDAVPAPVYHAESSDQGNPLPSEPPSNTAEAMKQAAAVDESNMGITLKGSEKLTKKQLRKEKREREKAEAEALAAAAATVKRPTEQTVVAQTVTAAPVVQPTPVQAAAPEAPKANRIEGVSMAKAGITKIWSDAIDFKSGIRVKVGEKFPSGEKLVSVDATNGRIVTDQRQILILE